jgi:hypothetical protein
MAAGPRVKNYHAAAAIGVPTPADVDSTDQTPQRPQSTANVAITVGDASNKFLDFLAQYHDVNVVLSSFSAFLTERVMRKTMLRRAIGYAFLGVVVMLGSAQSARAAATVGVTAPYYSTAYSPLVTSSAGYQVETFEPTSPTLATLGVTLSTVWPSSIVQGYSVDADDGIIDGSGATGHSLAIPTMGGTTGATFTFNNVAIGAYPLSAAVAVTAYDGPVLTFTVYDTSNNVSATDTLTGIATGAPTSDDFLFWASDPAGISAISVTSGNAYTYLFLDHLQYDTLNTISVPEPGTFACALAAAGSLIGRRRRRSAI